MNNLEIIRAVLKLATIDNKRNMIGDFRFDMTFDKRDVDFEAFILLRVVNVKTIKPHQVPHMFTLDAESGSLKLVRSPYWGNEELDKEAEKMAIKWLNEEVTSE